MRPCHKVPLIAHHVESSRFDILKRGQRWCPSHHIWLEKEGGGWDSFHKQKQLGNCRIVLYYIIYCTFQEHEVEKLNFYTCHTWDTSLSDWRTKLVCCFPKLCIHFLNLWTTQFVVAFKKFKLQKYECCVICLLGFGNQKYSSTSWKKKSTIGWDWKKEILRFYF